MQSRVDVIILKYQNLEVEIPCLTELLIQTKWPYQLTVYDNRDGTKNMAELWNQLIRDSSQEFIVILDSDTKVFSGWLTKLMEVMQEKQDCGVVVPRTNYCAEGLQVECNSSDPVRRINHGLVSGFCFLLRRLAYEDTGPFDEEFGFYGQDSEFFVRMAKKTHWGVYLQPSAYVFHAGHYSVKHRSLEESYDFTEDKRLALNLFRQKTANY